MPALAVLLIDFLGVLRTLAMCPISFTIKVRAARAVHVPFYQIKFE